MVKHIRGTVTRLFRLKRVAGLHGFSLRNAGVAVELLLVMRDGVVQPSMTGGGASDGLPPPGANQNRGD